MSDVSNSVVYIITDGAAYKIGFTSDVDSRIKDLQVGHPSELRIVAVRSGGRELETLMHEVLASHHVRGEWFAMGSDVFADFIALGFKLHVEHSKTPRTERSPVSKHENEALVSFLMRLYPKKTAQNVSDDIGVSVSTVNKWLSLGCMPNGNVFLKMIAVYGPEFLEATLPRTEPWVAKAVVQAKAGEIKLPLRRRHA